MRPIETPLLSVSLLGFSAAVNRPRAQEANDTADAEQPCTEPLPRPLKPGSRPLERST